MSKIEHAKDTLRQALSRLEANVARRIDELEMENSNLRTEIIKLKQKSKTTKSASTTKKEPDLLEEINKMNSKAASDVDVTLDELKKLVREG
jgi:hypothetical protein